MHLFESSSYWVKTVNQDCSWNGTTDELHDGCTSGKITHNLPFSPQELWYRYPNTREKQSSKVNTHISKIIRNVQDNMDTCTMEGPTCFKIKENSCTHELSSCTQTENPTVTHWWPLLNVSTSSCFCWCHRWIFGERRIVFLGQRSVM